MKVRFWLNKISLFKKIFLTDQLKNTRNTNADLKLKLVASEENNADLESKLEASEENNFILVESLKKMNLYDENRCIEGEKFPEMQRERS